ncbi:MAG: hypothetical protein IIC02_06845 [Planctomycetes bacterium]|nr:hypothetical protein [Planctomycetota bacterium]
MSSRNDCRVNVAAGHGPSGKRGGVDERGLGTRETMPKKGIKIKELAKELGVTAKRLLLRCREEGLKVQNSITKLPPQDERLVRSWFADKGGEA